MTQQLGFRHKITMSDYQRVCFFGNRPVKIFRKYSIGLSAARRTGRVLRQTYHLPRVIAWKHLAPGAVAGFRVFEQGTVFRNLS
jgi:hypothetical protein